MGLNFGHEGDEYILIRSKGQGQDISFGINKVILLLSYQAKSIYYRLDEKLHDITNYPL